jgi:hypothetical protein
MTKTWKLLSAIALAGAIAAACSSSSGTSAGATSPFKCGSSSGGGGGTTSTACNSCEEAHCSAQMTACFGSDFKGGSCASFVSCLNACDCSNYTCLAACSPSSACQTCMDDVSTCEETNCATECKTTTDAGSDAVILPEAGTGGCTALKACCPSVPASAQAKCNKVADAANDTNCNAVLGGFKTGGFCS